MNCFIVAATCAVLSGPNLPQPSLKATVILDSRFQAESKVLASEWQRPWRLHSLAVEAECSYQIRWLDSSRAAPQPFYPAVYVGHDGPYRVSCAGSGESIYSLHDTLMEWRKGVGRETTDEMENDWKDYESLRTGAFLAPPPEPEEE